MLVKLEKEIELEETLLLTEEPPPAVKTFSVCCQHGALYQAEVRADSGFFTFNSKASLCRLLHLHPIVVLKLHLRCKRMEAYG